MFLCALVLVSVSRTAEAQNPPSLSISVSTIYPGNLVIYGGGATYKVSDPPSPWTVSGSVTWNYRQTGGTKSGQPSVWEQDFGGLSWDTIEGTPGTFQIIAMVPLQTQQDQANPNPKSATVNATITITVAPPDGIILPQGPFTANWNQLNNGAGRNIGFKTDVVVLNFPVTCSRNRPVALPGAIALEDLIEISFFNLTLRNKIDVTVTLGGVSGTSIMDQKFITAARDTDRRGFYPTEPNPYPPGYVFTKYKQTLKLQINDWNGNPVIYTLAPSFTFTQTSSNGIGTPTTITVTGN